MPDFKKKTSNKPWKWLCLAATLLSTCAQVSDNCSDHNPYNPGSQFCFGGEPVDKCGGKTFNPPTQGCVSGIVRDKCPGDTLPEPGLNCDGTPYTIAYALTVNHAGTGSGTVTKRVNGVTTTATNFDNGIVVTMTAAANTGSAFGGWSGAGCSGTGNCTVTMTEPRTVTAMFTGSGITQYTVSYNINGGSGTTPSSQTVNAGNSVTVAGSSGFSRSGFTFAGWNTNSSGTGTNYSAGTSFTPSGSVTLYARWNVQQTGRIDGAPLTYDGQTYRTVIIGGKRWMAENLNYDVPGDTTDVCYNNDPSNCTTYGRLYYWATAMNLPSSCNTSSCASQVQTPNHQGICPNGWHVPTDTEWTALTDTVGGSSTAGTRLKSTTGWSISGNGTDDFGFSALPGGYWWSGIFLYLDVGYDGYWWGATEDDATFASYRNMSYYSNVNSGWVYGKANRFSLRCVED